MQRPPGHADPSGLAEMPALFLFVIPVLSLCPFTSSGMGESASCVLLTGYPQGVHCCEQYCESTEAPDCFQSLKSLKKLKPFKKLSCFVCTSLTLQRLCLPRAAEQAGLQAGNSPPFLPLRIFVTKVLLLYYVQKGQGLGNAGCAPFCCSFPPFYPGISFPALQSSTFPVTERDEVLPKGQKM